MKDRKRQRANRKVQHHEECRSSIFSTSFTPRTQAGRYVSFSKNGYAAKRYRRCVLYGTASENLCRRRKTKNGIAAFHDYAIFPGLQNP
ncbi:hypothetical protein [Synergistes jonesii]|uniref:hypothetical protein n=1 Tax=Synergistes jonesii TaxID=2754 RepID=UPI002431960B|nr:hypothetical protein [Synergistes jonesii]